MYQKFIENPDPIFLQKDDEKDDNVLANFYDVRDCLAASNVQSCP